MNFKKDERDRKEKDTQLMIEYIKNEEIKTKLREDEFKMRLNKIQAKMDKMANTVVKNENERKLKEELKLLNEQKIRNEELNKVEMERRDKRLKHKVT
jgi:predicted metal-dependent phosphoesterase TrpH